MTGFGDEPPAGSKEIYVTELANDQDRWVSVTDAARIGRRQEHTIRTWIQTGQLPVNPNRVGVNKRTRLVRLSDLATLTPVIDADAAIGTDIGMLDLPSIPKAFKALEADVLEFKVNVRRGLEVINGRLDGQGKSIEELRTFYLDLLKTFGEWKTGMEKLVDALSTHMTTALAELEIRMDEKWTQALAHALAPMNQRLQLQQDEQSAALLQATTTLHQEMATGLLRQSEEQATALQQATDGLHLEITTRLENAEQAQEQALTTAQERIIQLQQETAEGLHRRISDLARLTTEQFRSRDLAIAAAHTEGSQARQATRSLLQSTERLQQQLDRERKARELLAKDLQTAQQERKHLADDLTKEQQERADLAERVAELAKLVENPGKKK